MDLVQRGGPWTWGSGLVLFPISQHCYFKTPISSKVYSYLSCTSLSESVDKTLFNIDFKMSFLVQNVGLTS